VRLGVPVRIVSVGSRPRLRDGVAARLQESELLWTCLWCASHWGQIARCQTVWRSESCGGSAGASPSPYPAFSVDEAEFMLRSGGFQNAFVSFPV
jgi:hypothetical protein